MKPTPRVSMQSAITSGDTAKFTPSSDSTSEEPLELETDRLPCFAMRPPAAATTKVAAVDTLNKSAPSPPVPARSMRPLRSISTGVASDRMALAAPTISSMVSPFIRSPTNKPPICASVAWPCMTASITCSISARLKDWPSTTCAIACWIFIPFTALQGKNTLRAKSMACHSPLLLKKVPEHVMAMLG